MDIRGLVGNGPQLLPRAVQSDWIRRLRNVGRVVVVPVWDVVAFVQYASPARDHSLAWPPFDLWFDALGCGGNEVVAAGPFFRPHRAHSSGCICSAELVCIGPIESSGLSTGKPKSACYGGLYSGPGEQ